MKTAFLVAFIYWMVMNVSKITGAGAINRPIILGTITGLACGDIKNGIIMGGLLEAVYMGVSGIGGVSSSNVQLATVISVALTTLSNIDFETGCAIAVTIGTLTNNLKRLSNGIIFAIHPLYIKLAENGQYKKYRVVMWLQQLLINEMPSVILAFFVILFGETAVSTILQVLPAWLLTGLNACAGMLVVVGLCLTTQAIWNDLTFVFVLLGFVLSKYVGLDILPIAALGMIIAYLIFKLEANKKTVVNVESEKDGGFYD